MKILRLLTVVSSACIIFISCQKQLDFGTGDISEGTLKKSSTGDCLPATVNGLFEVDSLLTDNSFVDVQVDVSIEGTFDIRSDTVNGFSFSKTGSVGKGINTVRLYPSGKPLAADTSDFIIKYGNSTCTFSIIVTGVTTVPTGNLDYIPETSFSNWSDKLVGGSASDTSYVQVSPNTKVINGFIYRIFEVKDTGNPVDSFYHRKNGGSYYQLYEGDYGIFDAAFSKDGLILDSSKAVGDTWTIALGTNSVGGFPVTAKINCVIVAKNASATIGINNYTKIIKVKYSYVGNLGLGDIVFAEEERWYAKGFGLIYDKINDVPVTTTTELETTRIQIF